jgi:cephalosporin hydroxylase
MNPIEQFQKERATQIAGYRSDSTFCALSKQWLEISMNRKYVYNFDWLGRPIIQYPSDMVAVQELIWKTKPDLIIETGIAHGGSLILSASMLALLDLCEAIENGQPMDPKISRRKVVGVDIDIRAHNRAAVEAHPMASRIRMIEGSSIAPQTIVQVRTAAADHERILVCLDSMHTHAHVLSELNAYASLVTPESYCIVFDTFVEDMPPRFFPDRPWDIGNNPKTAVRQWLETHPEFEIDRTMENKLMVTVAPEGFLKRTG